MRAEELRKSILQQAIQGKLVKQDPNDEPASVLLERIKAEKDKLVKEGKIKKDKEESYIYKGDDNRYYEKIGKKDPIDITDDLDFDIPDSWIFVRLKEIAYFSGGFAFKSNKFSETGIRVIRISDFDRKGIKNDKVVRYPFSNDLLKNKIHIWDILMCMTGGTVGKSLLVESLEEDAYINQRVAKITSFIINQKYLYNVVSSNYILSIINESKNSTNDNISMEDIESFLIPLPPLAEQERIVKRIEELMPLVDEYARLEAKDKKLDEKLPAMLKQSILQYVMEGKLVKQDPNDEPASVLLERIKAEKEQLIKEGKIKRDKNETTIIQDDDKNYYEKNGNSITNIIIPFSIPHSWKWIRIREILSSIQYGYNASSSECGVIKFLRISDISNGKVNWDSVPYCSIDEANFDTYKIKKNDIFIARTGGTIGKSFLLNDNISDAVFAGYLIRFRLIDTNYSDYIYNFMQSTLYWNQVVDKSMGTGQPNINGVSLGNLLVPLPPSSEKNRILNKINDIFNLI